MSKEQIEELYKFSACDIADALLKLGVPGAGFLTDIKPIPSAPSLPNQQPKLSDTPSNPSPQTSTPKPSIPLKVIAPASTALFLSKSSDSFPNATPPLTTLTQTLSQPLPNIPPGTPYADLTTPNTILIISQPPNQSCAVVGGIMAARMQYLGVKGIIVDGRVRDLDTLRGLGLPVWSRGTSVVGSGGEAKAWSMGVEVQVGGVSVRSGDLVVVDYVEGGVVVIPARVVGDVLGMLPKLVEADGKVMRDVKGGGEVGEAFGKWRG
ncbi:DlpA domain-containing protein [Tothia fuscella]|uniref:DlpA domain-containing protein n=1 Tax=Tothia fuscella TaxID=1048955 RepID=A0A9P4U082_9PEZI|nr:DlpA domain-containing protein [Tothia fuscella]